MFSREYDRVEAELGEGYSPLLFVGFRLEGEGGKILHQWSRRRWWKGIGLVRGEPSLEDGIFCSPLVYRHKPNSLEIKSWRYSLRWVNLRSVWAQTFLKNRPPCVVHRRETQHSTLHVVVVRTSMCSKSVICFWAEEPTPTPSIRYEHLGGIRRRAREFRHGPI